MEKKFELVEDDTLLVHNCNGDIINLYRIRALKDISCPIKIRNESGTLASYTVKEGELGGYVEKEENLSHEGGCWVFDKARVYDDSRIEDNAQIFHHAVVSEDSIIKDDASILDLVRVTNSVIGGYTKITNNSVISGSQIMGDDRIVILGRSQISDSTLKGKIYLDSANVTEAEVLNNLHLSGFYHVSFNTKSNEDIATYRTTKAIRPMSRTDQELNRFGYVTAATKEDIWDIFPFWGTGEELIQYVEENYPSSTDYYRNLVAFHKQQYGL